MVNFMEPNEQIATKLQDIKSGIDSCDFFNIIERLVLIEGWSAEHAKQICEQYRRYLYLKIKYGQQYALPPSREIDQAWHAHILYTDDYISFCNQVLGGYLHHHPQHGLGDQKVIRSAISKSFVEETQKFHFEEYGSYIYDLSGSQFLTELKRIFNKYFVSSKSKLRQLDAIKNEINNAH